MTVRAASLEVEEGRVQRDLDRLPSWAVRMATEDADEGAIGSSAREVIERATDYASEPEQYGRTA